MFEGTKNGLIAIIGDDDTVTGMLLAGCGNVDEQRRANFLVVDSRTPPRCRSSVPHAGHG